MDVLRHFGAAGGDAYRQARQVGGLGSGPSMMRPDGTPAAQRDPGEVWGGVGWGGLRLTSLCAVHSALPILLMWLVVAALGCDDEF